MTTYYVVLTLPNHTPDEDPADDRASVAMYLDQRVDGEATVYSSFDDLAADHADGVA